MTYLPLHHIDGSPLLVNTDHIVSVCYEYNGAVYHTIVQDCSIVQVSTGQLYHVIESVGEITNLLNGVDIDQGVPTYPQFDTFESPEDFETKLAEARSA